ncbi:antibiotic biosynthesis monooxygenase [Streptomyces sp. NPDC054884]|uniref:antibiotic biosynthesis monooxygenase n=1 Tax=Streptomyces sp. ME08-AFT2 TaxID=3028683 RepID=UPI0029A5D186|nr:antibiotic biosynthesis monooxygenase [Streptomyces sp. ME08-AFT2]MDX3307934.1 antibiotic biosynthesis monooxygenase [Streptomyces sp. ME08-AFT2]
MSGTHRTDRADRTGRAGRAAGTDTTDRDRSAGATAVIHQKVLPGLEREYESWQEGVNSAAAGYAGYVGVEVTPPTPVQPEWVVVYRFDSVAHLKAWIDSDTRQRLLDVGDEYLDGPGTQQVIGGGTRPTDPLVTVVVTHRVDPAHVDEFLAWQRRLTREEEKFEGFRGTEIFQPVEGVQDDWTTLYRFDNAEHLDAWLTSSRRRQLLAEGEKFDDFRLHTVDHSFGSWFAFEENGGAAAPSETRTALAVWVGLYPTVVLLTLALSPLDMPLWLGLLVGNLLSSFLMSFLTMPYYVNRLLKRWLRPAPDEPATRTHLIGLGTVTVLMAFWVAVFYVITTQIWTLP